MKHVARIVATIAIALSMTLPVFAGPTYNPAYTSPAHAGAGTTAGGASIMPLTCVMDGDNITCHLVVDSGNFLLNGGFTSICDRQSLSQCSAVGPNGGLSVNSGMSSAGPAMGVIADNPSNAACNGSTAGLMCGITLTSTTITTLVSLTASKQVHVMFLSATNSSATSVPLQLYQGSNVGCGSNQATIGAPILVPAGGGFVLPMAQAPYSTSTAGYAVCAATLSAVSSVYVNAAVAIF